MRFISESKLFQGDFGAMLTLGSVGLVVLGRVTMSFLSKPSRKPGDQEYLVRFQCWQQVLRC